jgi:hypothetical protein
MAIDFSTYWGSLSTLDESMLGTEVPPLPKKPTDTQSVSYQSKDAEHSHHKAGRDFRYGINKDTDLLNGGISGDSEASNHRPERAISDRDSHN